jgi:hypothetical protein
LYVYGDEKNIHILIKEFYEELQSDVIVSKDLFLDVDLFYDERLMNDHSNNSDKLAEIWMCLKSNKELFLNNTILERNIDYIPILEKTIFMYTMNAGMKNITGVMIQLPLQKNVPVVKQIIFPIRKLDDRWRINLLWTSINGVYLLSDAQKNQPTNLP